MKEIDKNTSESYSKSIDAITNSISGSTGVVKERNLIEEKLKYIENNQAN